MEKQMTRITGLAAAIDFTVSLWQDGTVSIAGKGVRSGRVKKKEIEAFSDVVQIAAGESSGVAALTDQGTVLLAGLTRYEKWRHTVSKWENIAFIALGDHCLAGVDTAGNVVVAGDEEAPDIAHWQNMQKIALYGTFAIGVKKDGTVQTSGYHERNYWLDELKQWQDIDDVAIGSQYSVAGSTLFVAGLKKDGSVVCAAKYPVFEQQIEAWRDMKALYGGMRYALLGLKKDGTIAVYQSHGESLDALQTLCCVTSLTASENFAVAVCEDHLAGVGDSDCFEDLALRPSAAQARAAALARAQKRGKWISGIAAGVGAVLIAVIWLTGILRGYAVTMPSGKVIASVPVFFSVLIALVCMVVICFAWPEQEKRKPTSKK